MLSRYPFAMMPLTAVVATVVTGMLTRNPLLQSFVSGHVGMKPLTAALFTVVIAGFLSTAGRTQQMQERLDESTANRRNGLFPARVQKRIAIACGIITTAFGALSLFEYLLGADVGTGRLFGDDPLRLETIMPGRMAPLTAAGFTALGLVLLLLPSPRPAVVRTRRVLVTMVLLIGLAATIGFLYGAREFRGMQAATPMALPTALALMLSALAAGKLGHGDAWPWSLLEGNGTTARVSRFLIPATLLIPIVAGAVRLEGESRGWFGRELGTSLIVLSHIIALLAILLWALTRLQRSESAQRKHEEMLQRILAAQHTIGELAGAADQVSCSALSLLMEATGGDGAALLTLHGGRLTWLYAGGMATPLQGTSVAEGESFASRAIAERTTHTIPDSSSDPLVEQSVRELAAGRAIVVVPTEIALGNASGGAIAVFSKIGETFDSGSEDELRLISSSVSASLLRAERRERDEAIAAEQAAEMGLLQERYMAFMRHVPAAAFTKDRAGRYLEANEAMAKVCGLPLPDLLGQRDADILSPGVAEMLRLTDEQIFEGGDSVQLDLHVPSPDGAIEWWRVIHFPITDTLGRTMIGGLGFDITQLVDAQRVIAEMNANLERTVLNRTEELRRANTELEGFSYTVSHDLRAPLRAIDGYSRILEEDYGASLDTEARRYLGTVRSETRRMGELIDDLLAFSQLGRKPLTPDRIDLAGMACEIIEELQRDIGGRSIDLRMGTLPMARADRGTIRQVMVNLLSNAVKYSGHGEGTIVIELEGRTVGREHIYTVRDYGAGFDMKYADKLFGVFQRLHSDAEFEGTGVGLAIVERVIARHGGRVWAESRVGEGATFSFALPVESSPVPAASSAHADSVTVTNEQVMSIVSRSSDKRAEIANDA